MVAPIVAAAGIGAASSLLGGFMNRKATKSANQANLDMQREFAKNSLQWKTEDAKKAGLHPLAALGATGYSPTTAMQPESMGNAVAGAGKSISDAIMSHKVNELSLQNLKLRNDFIQEQIDASQSARAKIGSNIHQDLLETGVVNPGTTSTHVPAQTSAQEAQDELGEILGEVHAIKRAAGQTVRHYHGEKEDRKRAGWMIDKRTGRVARNPNYRRSKQTRRGRRYY